MKRWEVSRAYGTRISWEVEAETEEEALELLDDEEACPSHAGKEEWLGLLTGPEDFEDEARELS